MRNKVGSSQVVPWRSKAEWIQVYEKLYSSQVDDLEWAVNQVAVWQQRCPTSSLIGVETTSLLVRARILDLNQSAKEQISDAQSEVSMVYAMAIVRFVNLVTETGKSTRAHVTPIRNIAHGMGIPEWLVNLRNSAAHKFSLPSLDMLRVGTSLALEWLKINYWLKEIENFDDLVLQDSGSEDGAVEKIRNCLHEFQNIHYSVIYGEKDGNIIKANRTVLLTIVNTLRSLLKKYRDTFIEVLSESGYLLPKYHHLEALLKPGEKDFLDGNSINLPLSLEKFWTPVFHLFCQNKHLQCLLSFLLEPRIPEDEFSSRLAAAWALHILNIISSQECGLFTFIPSLNWIQLLSIALKKPTQYSPHVLTAICENVPLSEDIKQELMSLVAIFLGSVTSKVIPKKLNRVYTVEDVTRCLPHGEKKQMDSGPWRLYAGADWHNLPIGCVIEPPTTKADKTKDENSFVINETVEIEPIITEPTQDPDNMITETDNYDEDVNSGQSLPKEKEVDLSMSLIFM